MTTVWDHLAADLLRENRRKAGLSQRALARRAGVAQPEVARIESGRVQPSLAHLGRLLDAIGVEVGVEARLVDHRLSAVEAARTVSEELARGSEARALRIAFV
ncbi:MAG: helix-turn-helix domain-containing protein, partial [Acidimicrobiales bacterium]